MIKYLLKNIQQLLVISLVGVTVACSKEPAEPTKENELKGHEGIARAEFVIRSGHLHNAGRSNEYFHGGIETPISPIQRFVFEVDPTTKNFVRKDMSGKILTENDPIGMVEGQVYALEIIYYNAKGERINAEFSNERELPIHQIFFEVDRYTDTQTGAVTTQTDDLWNYKYRDTNPEDVQLNQQVGQTTRQSTLIGSPLGLKGYFIPKKAYTKFDVHISLFHIQRGTKKNGEGYYPFNKPSDALKGRAESDFSQKIPVHIFSKLYSDDSQADRYYQELADFYHISKEQVKAIIREGSKKTEDSPYEM